MYLALATAATAACHFCCHFCNCYCDCSCNCYCDRSLCNASLLKTQLSVSNLLSWTEERSARKNVRTQKQCCNGMVGLGSLGGGSAPVVSCMLRSCQHCCGSVGSADVARRLLFQDRLSRTAQSILAMPTVTVTVHPQGLHPVMAVKARLTHTIGSTPIRTKHPHGGRTHLYFAT